MKKELVFIIDSAFPNSSGGRETWLYNIFKELLDRDYDITLVNHKKFFKNKKPFFELSKDVNVISVPMLPALLKSTWPFGRLFKAFNSYLLAFLTYYKLLTKYKKVKEKPLLICMNPGFQSLPGYWMSHKGFKYISCVRGHHAKENSCDAFFCKKLWFKFYRGLVLKTLNNADQIFVNGYDTDSYVKDFMDKKYHKKIKMVPNGINFNKYSPYATKKSSKKFTVLTISTLRPITAIDTIIESIPDIIKKIENIEFVFAGKGDQEPYLKLAKKLNVFKYVTFLGQRRDILDLLKGADLVMCVDFVGSGLSHSTLEGLASSTVVLAFDSEIYTQIIKHKDNGLLIKERDPKDMADKIIYILKNDSLREKIQINARKSVEKYDWKKVTTLFINKIKST